MTSRRNMAAAVFALMLVIMACTCGPLSGAQDILATGQAAATDVNQVLPSLEAEASQFVEQATELAPTYQAEMTQIAATAAALGIDMTAAATGQPSILTPGTDITYDENAVLQWAQSATASSEYSAPEWGAIQAAGEPNTAQCGDITTAWATATSSEMATLTLTYAQSVIPTHINIYQTYNPGAVSQVQVVEPNGTPHTVYNAQPRIVEQCPYVLAIKVEGVDVSVNQVIVTIDQTNHTGWNEIDAVQLVGFSQ